MSKSELVNKHIERWKNTRQYLETLDPSMPEWAIMVCFHSMLHGVQALIVNEDRDEPKSHTQRNYELNKLGHELDHEGKRAWARRLTSQYTTLRQTVLHARYEPEFTEFTTTVIVQSLVIDGQMARIEEDLKLLLGVNLVGSLPPIKLKGC